MIAQLDKVYIRQFPKRAIVRIIAYLLEGRPITTKGRWFNYFIIIFFSIIKRIKFRKNIEYISIKGLGRGGSTILGKILSVNSHVLWLNEPKLLWYSVSKLDDIIGSYSMYNNGLLRRQSKSTINEYKYARNLFSFLGWMTNSTVIVDKYPEMVFRHVWLESILPDHKSIIIIRHPYTLAASIQNWNIRHSRISSNQVQNWWGKQDRKWLLLNEQVVAKSKLLRKDVDTIRLFSDDVSRGLVEWICVAEAATDIDNQMILRLEDLQQEPENQLNLIYDFVNMDLDKKKTDYLMNLIKEKHVYSDIQIRPILAKPLNELMKKYNYYG